MTLRVIVGDYDKVQSHIQDIEYMSMDTLEDALDYLGYRKLFGAHKERVKLNYYKALDPKDCVFINKAIRKGDLMIVAYDLDNRTKFAKTSTSFIYDCGKSEKANKPDIFKVINSLLDGDVYAMHDILKMVEDGESPVKFLSLLYTSLRNLFLCTHYENLDIKDALKASGLTLWQWNININLVGRHSEGALLGAMRRAQSAEIAIKTGTMSQDHALMVMCLSLLK